MKKIFALLWLLLPLTGLAQSHPDYADWPARPNIVWITCEDMSLHLSCFGETEIKTPNLDALAAEGVKFTHMYTVAGVCAPSRSGIITAMYPSAIGSDNMRNFTPGKGRAKQGKDDFSGIKSYSIVPPDYVKGYPEYLRMAGYYCTNNPKQDYQFEAPVTMWDESSAKATWRNCPAGKPFFAIFNLNVTHEAQVWERDKLPLLVDPKTVIVPPYYPDVPETRHDLARFLSNVITMDQQAGKIIQQLKNDGLYDNTIIIFCSDHGDGLPFVKREVLLRGLHIPLIVKFPHSKYAGQVDSRMLSGIDFGPTILSLAGVKVPAYMSGKPFLGKQQNGEGRKYIFAARDRMDSEVDRVRAVFDGRYQYLRNYMPEKPYYQNIIFRLKSHSMSRILGMRDSGLLNATQMLWFRKTKPVDELYDTQTDPDEFKNLAADAKYKNKLQELKKAMDKWLAEVGDANAKPEKQLISQWWGGKTQPPVTAMPKVVITNKGVTISCATPGASIGYKIIKAGTATQSKAWDVYQTPLQLNKGDELIIKAQRIGYKAAVLTYVNK